MSGEELYKKKIKEKKRVIVLHSIINVFVSLFLVCFAYLSKWLLDSIGTDKFVTFAVVLGIVIVLEVASKILITYLSNKEIYKFEKSLRKEVYFHYLALSEKESEAKKDGEYTSLLMSDVKVVSDGVISYIPNVVFLISQIVFAFAALALIDYLFAICLFAVGVVIYFITKILRKKSKKLHKKMQESEAINYSYYQEGVSHSFLYRLFGVKKHTEQKIDYVGQRYYDDKMHYLEFSLLLNGGFLFFMRVSYFIAIIYAALRFDHGMQIGSLLAMVQLIAQIERPFSSLSGILPKYYATIGSFERLLECGINELTPISEDKISFEGVRIEHLSFSYDNEEIIHDLSLELKSHQFYLFEGPSGCGKSTLMKLLMGVYNPDSGSINYLEHENEDPRRFFSYVPQGNYLINGTIYENLTLFTDNVDEKEVDDALIKADLYDKVHSLEKGVNSPLSDFGEGLSMGEGQRLAIARALLIKRPVLVLDEITSSLDEESEEKLLKNLKELDYTIFFVSHRKKARAYADQIIEFTSQGIKVKGHE